MENISLNEPKISWLDKPVFSFWPKFSVEHLITVILILLTIISRFYDVGHRDMDHDEVNHVVPSYSLYQGNGYQHDPVTHGPMQFHLIAASYFLFGDSDTSSHIPSVVFSIATVIFVIFAFKRYLGRIGALLAGLFFMISPFMLFYGRYIRNESFVALFGVMTIFAVLKYLEEGRHSTLILYSVVLSLQYCTKEVSYIYTASMLIFLAVVFISDSLKKTWFSETKKKTFAIAMIFAILLAGIAVTAAAMDAKASSATQPFANEFLQSLAPLYHTVLLMSLGLAALAIVLSIFSLITGLHWAEVKKIRSFDLLVLTIVLVLPLLTAFPVKLLGWDPLDYSDAGLIHTSIVLGVMTLLSIALGVLWNPSVYLVNVGIFYAIFTVLYTTFFTNGQGFFTGMVGSLGYWLSQQGFARGTQPWYYYLFPQITMYEYLGLFGLILAFIYANRHNLFSTWPGLSPYAQHALHESKAEEAVEDKEPVTETVLEQPAEPVSEPDLAVVNDEAAPRKLPVLSFLVYWSIISLIAYSYAGEKMPWLTVHIALPMLLAAGWGVGYLIESIPWKKLANKKGILVFALIPVFVIAIAEAVGALLSPNKPFAGMELAQLQTTSTFLFSVLAAIFSGWGIVALLNKWAGKDILRLMLVTFFGILTVLTARSAYQANFINYDNAKEFLVYAHGAAGAKQVAKQVEDISFRMTGGKDIKVAYIGDALYPYWWYFRDYPNKLWLKDNITRDLQNYPLVIADDTYLSQTQSVLGDNYYQFDYKRLWWPMQDYTNLNWQRIWDAVKNPQMIEALFNIWYNKDYTLYASLTNSSTLTVETWQPSASIHFFIKKDIVASIWNYGSLPTTAVTAPSDPYAEKLVSLTPDQFIGQVGVDAGQFTSPRSMAIAPDGSIYVADSGNNRIEHFKADGTFINMWGSLGDVSSGAAPGGTFKEPWGIAVGPDGSVYVADTWNFRIQKFSADGEFITMWGVAGQAETPDAFWGPRGLAVDKNGHVYVTDTGNKRVVVFDGNGNFIAQFGSAGVGDGQFDEPVGLAVDTDGSVYVADTWNMRIQVFISNETGTEFTFSRSWNVDSWESQSTDNKPFLAVDSQGNVFAADPDKFRILEFNSEGKIVRVWGGYSSGLDGFGKPVGIAVDATDHVWVVDSGNNTLLRFTLPALGSESVINGELPAFPTSPVTLSLDTSLNELVDSFGNSYYRLDESKTQWVPVVPADILSAIPEGTTPTRTADGLWILAASDGTVLYQWNEGALLWVASGEQPTTAQ